MFCPLKGRGCLTADGGAAPGAGAAGHHVMIFQSPLWLPSTSGRGVPQAGGPLHSRGPAGTAASSGGSAPPERPGSHSQRPPVTPSASAARASVSTWPSTITAEHTSFDQARGICSRPGRDPFETKQNCRNREQWAKRLPLLMPRPAPAHRTPCGEGRTAQTPGGTG